MVISPTARSASCVQRILSASLVPHFQYLTEQNCPGYSAASTRARAAQEPTNAQDPGHRTLCVFITVGPYSYCRSKSPVVKSANHGFKIVLNRDFN
jgi:hypothetical protein